MMFSQSQQCEEKTLGNTQTSVTKQSLTQTEILPVCAHPQLHSFNSQNTLPQTLPYHSRALDFDQNTFSTFQQQLLQLQHRFNGIHKILINHSQFQSALHETKKGYKSVPIDPGSLNNDYSNKVNIINDIDQLIKGIEKGVSNDFIEDQAGDILETKFQQYYLQRHYGTLACNFDTLSIQQNSRCESKQNYLSEIKQEEKCIISKIGNFQSLIPESKITYSEQFCQTQEVDYGIIVPVPKIIQVQVPVLVYKIKDMLVRCEESDLSPNMDDIINHFSMPYEDIYSQASSKNIKKGTNLVPSVVPSTLEQQQATQVELAYSDFPEEDNLKLPLDSYAQIQSLISNSEKPDTQREKSFIGDGHETEAVFITQKVVSRSIIQKYQQSQRALLEENVELKEYVMVLETQLSQNKKQNSYLHGQNNKLSRRLEEEIQQTEYFSSKLEDLNIQLLEQKVLSLTHINESKDRKVEMMSNQISTKEKEIHLLWQQLEELEVNAKNLEILLQKKEEQISSLSRMLEQKDHQLTVLTTCEDDVIQVASSTQITLKEQIEKLERQKSLLKQNLKFCEQRLQNEGISLQMEQAHEIKGYIEQREHNFNLELQEVNQKYNEIISSYQSQLNELKNQLQILKDEGEWKKRLIDKQKLKEVQIKKQQQINADEFEEIIDEYNKELEEKDNQILQLKKKMEVKLELNGQIEVQLIIQRAHHSIQVLQRQLKIQRSHKMQLSSQLLHLDKLIQLHLHSSPSKLQAQSLLLQQVSQELEKQMEENSKLRDQLQQHSYLHKKKSDSQMSPIIEDENKRLKRMNEKLKKYSLLLESEIKAICFVDECDSHRSYIETVTKERDYYMNMMVGGRNNQIIC